MSKIKSFILKNKTTLVVLLFFISVFFAPHILLIFISSSKTYSSLSIIPKKEYGIVFGAQVYDNQRLSDVTRERIEGAILLYHERKIEKLFISGDNRHNNEVDNIAKYAIERGVSRKDIFADYLGIDTHDTCRHFKKLAIGEAILVTQTFHLPRAMYMCERNEIRSLGLAVNELELLESRGANKFQIYRIRLVRFVRESLLTWLFVSGIYDRLSNEAESMQSLIDAS
jgi:vancomycin permeability regulator SanA